MRRLGLLILAVTFAHAISGCCTHPVPKPVEPVKIEAVTYERPARPTLYDVKYLPISSTTNANAIVRYEFDPKDFAALNMNIAAIGEYIEKLERNPTWASEEGAAK